LSQIRGGRSVRVQRRIPKIELATGIEFVDPPNTRRHAGLGYITELTQDARAATRCGVSTSAVRARRSSEPVLKLRRDVFELGALQRFGVAGREVPALGTGWVWQPRLRWDVVAMQVGAQLSILDAPKDLDRLGIIHHLGREQVRRSGSMGLEHVLERARDAFHNRAEAHRRRLDPGVAAVIDLSVDRHCGDNHVDVYQMADANSSSKERLLSNLNEPPRKAAAETVEPEHDGRDRAGAEHWDAVWQQGTLPRAARPDARGIWHHRERQWHAWFARAFAGIDTQGKRLLEIGAARSEWLPYFAQQFGFIVTGLDYSELGVEQCRQVLTNEGVRGDVVLGDFRTPPSELVGAFDVVTSFGVIEHFEDTSQAIRQAACMVKPGGLLISVVPNMTGMVGWLQRALNRPVYDIHVALNRERLLAAHQAAGLTVERCDYSIVLPFGVANLHGLPAGPSTRVKEVLHYGLQITSAAAWWIDERLPLPGPNALTAGYVLCAARVGGNRDR